jgi:hypothetical protein
MQSNAIGSDGPSPPAFCLRWIITAVYVPVASGSLWSADTGLCRVFPEHHSAPIMFGVDGSMTDTVLDTRVECATHRADKDLQ